MTMSPTCQYEQTGWKNNAYFSASTVTKQMSLDFSPHESADPSRPLWSDLIPIILQMLLTEIKS